MALYSVVSGNQIVILDANQYLNLMTGVMTDQVVSFGNDLVFFHDLLGTYPVVDGGRGGGVLTWDFSNSKGEVDLWNNHYFSGSSTESFRFYQRYATAAATLLGGMFPSGGWYIGPNVPSDPGQGGLNVGGVLLKGYTSGGLFIGPSPSDPGAGLVTLNATTFELGVSSGVQTVIGSSGIIEVVVPGGHGPVDLILDPANGTGTGYVMIDYPSVTGHTTSAGRQLAIKDSTGTVYYIPLNS